MICWRCHSNSINTEVVYRAVQTSRHEKGGTWFELTWFETTVVRATSIFSEYNNTILYHNKYRNYKKYIYYHLKHPFYLLKRVFLSFFDSYLGNFKSRSTIFQNIFQFYNLNFIFSYWQASAIWFLSCLLHIYYIPNHIVGAMISELAPSDVHCGFESGAGQTNG